MIGSVVVAAGMMFGGGAGATVQPTIQPASFCGAGGVVTTGWGQGFTFEVCMPVAYQPHPADPAPVETVGYWDTPSATFIRVTVAECAAIPQCSG